MFLSLSPYQTDMGLYTLKKFCDIDDDIHKQVCKSFGINPQEIEPSQKFDKEVGEIREEEVANQTAPAKKPSRELVDAIASAYPCELLCNTRESLRHPELFPRRRDEEKR